MATMRWKNISLPIAQGVDTKTDSKALQPGKLANLENGVFTKGGSVIKRNGYDKLSDTIVNSTIIATAPTSASPTSARGLHTKDGELLLADDERLLSYVSATDEWRSRGRFKSVEIDTETIVDRDTEQAVGDCATLDNVTVYAWEDNGGLFISVLNEDTKTVYMAPASVNVSGIRPKVVAVGTAIHVYYYIPGDSGVLYRIIVRPSDLAALDVSGYISEVVVSDLHASVCRYDVCVDSANVYIAYYTDHGSDKLKVLRLGSGGEAIEDQDYTEVPSSAISICREPNTGVLSVAWEGGSGVRQMFIEGITLQQLGLTTELADADSAPNVLNIASSFRRDQQVRPLAYVLDLEASVSQYAEMARGETTDALALRDSITIEAWVKFESLPTGGNKMTFVSRDENTTDNKGYYFRYVDGSPDTLQFGCRDSAGAYVTASTNFTAVVGTWYHLAVTHDKAAGTVQFFQGGATLGSLVSGLATTRSEASASDFRIGSENGVHTNYFDGMISEVRIWSEVKAASEIAASMNKELTGIQNNLAGYWRFNNNYEDSSGNGNALTPVPGSASTIVFVHAIAAGFNTLAFTSADTEAVEHDYPVVVFWELDIAQDYNHEVHVSQLSRLGTLFTGAMFRRHSGIASRAWTDQNDVHVNLVHASAFQTTYFTYLFDNLTANGVVVAKMEPGVAKGIVTESHLPNVQDLGNSLYQWVGGFRKKLDT